MNIVLYAGDKKYHSVLEPIAKELKENTSNNFLFYYTKSTQLLYPTHQPHIGQFEYDGQINGEDPVNSFSLGIQLPFKPEVLIIARERWQPEQSIIQEFKEKWNCIICCVEVSSHLSNNIENRLEMLSRNNPPQNQVDYFFEHSEWAKSRRIDCLDESFGEKSIVVGNTRDFYPQNLDLVYEKYKIDPSKQQILFWGVINTTRNTTLKALQTLAEKTKDTHQIFYKCYPGEPYNEVFKKQFNPFCIPGVTVIYDENDIYPLAEICDTHIAAASSVFNFAFAYNKKIVNLDSICNASDKMNDINCYIQETKKGVEDSAKFWMGVWKLNTIEDFKNLIDLKRINKFKHTNKEYMKSVKNNTIDFDWDCKFLSTPKKDYGDLINYFDSYNLDKNTPNRIINFLKTKIK
jgi:hypothetical protein